MAQWQSVGNGSLIGSGVPDVQDLDASKLTITQTQAPKDIPALETLVFGQTTTDHMLTATFDPKTGWSAPEIKPYGPLSLDPASSCLQYSSTVFEGMKAYVGPDGTARLFRPRKNMERLVLSTARVALPPFNPNALLELIKRLIVTEKRWIPNQQGYSLYLRPTIIGTRASLGVTASDSATLYVICSPCGPYFRSGPKPIALLAVDEHVRSWPGGTGGHKLGVNYAPGFQPQREAAKKGYDQILWLLGDENRITEAGAMNFFVVVKSDNPEVLDVITPPLDGTILPGVTRDSCLAMFNAHNSQTLVLPGISSNHRFSVKEEAITMADVARWSGEGKLLEAFGVGTAVIVAPVGRIGFRGTDFVLPLHEGGLGPVGNSLWKLIVDIQEGRSNFEEWGFVCE